MDNGGSNPSSFRNENQRAEGVIENSRLIFFKAHFKCDKFGHLNPSF